MSDNLKVLFLLFGALGVMGIGAWLVWIVLNSDMPAALKVFILTRR